MRYLPDAPNGIMDYLFVSLLLWGKERGFTAFNMGMAPLAGLENHPLSPVWMRMGVWVFGHGEHFYNFQGLRRYKEKFNPQWRPRYLASLGSVQLPNELLGINALISGGILKTFQK
jgi:phosphatidylglycerol lysyltransferase